jgi:hypothetical protein
MTDSWYFALCVVGGTLVGYLTRNNPIIVTVLVMLLVWLMLTVIRDRSIR